MPSRRPPLTDIALRKLAPPPCGQAELWDGKVSGFGVRVTAAGTKTFVLLYRHNGRPKRLTLGRYPVVSLEKARAKAYAALTAIADGGDPQGEKRADIALRQGASGFAAYVDAFVETHAKRHNRPQPAAEAERILKKTFVPVWSNRALDDITKDDVLAVLDRIMAEDKPSAARHAFARLRKFFNWCIERGLIEASPCANMKAPAPELSRDRVLTDDELCALWQASQVQGYPFGTIFQLLVLTAQRRGEVVGLRWSELDFAKKIWTLPAARTKNGRAHTLPLTPQVKATLEGMPRLSTDLVFPARGKLQQAYSGYSKGKRALNDDADLSDWTLHDLRRTAATGMAQLGVQPHVVERVLNHVSGSFGGVAGVYNRFSYLAEMREALAAWEAHVLRVAAAR